jgi:gamma-glutamylcyclotransferase (GGCT)/AIG2-like uncharacterized protein YtfP
MNSNSDKTLDGLTLVAVYGTLKRGLSNHYLIQDALYLGSDSLRAITLYDLGPYPGAKSEVSDGINIEVFAVTDAQLQALDELEEYNSEAPEQGMYNRLAFETRFGTAWVYLYNRPVDGLAALRRGSWQPDQAQVLQVLPDSQNNKL